MNMIDEFNYLLYISESTINHAYFNAVVQESLLIAEEKNTVNNMNAITEGFVDTVKGAVGKIIEALTRIWGRFVEAVTGLVRRDSTYLTKYKDIILNKMFTDNYTFTMYDYQKGQKDLLGVYAPAFSFNGLQDKLVDEETFVKSSFPKIYQIQQQNKDLSFSDAAKILFRGSSEEIKIEASKFNMTDAYNYCMAFKDISNKLSTDSKNIKAAAQDVQSKINQMGSQNNNTQNESVDLFAYPSYISYLYENMVINEVEINNNNPTNNNSNSGSNNNSNNTSSNTNSDNKTTTDPNKAMNNQQGQSDPNVSKDDVKKSGGVDQSVKKVELYIKIVGQLMTAKCQISEEIYKAYMQIIRAHVKDHVGKSDDSMNKDTEQATNQGNDNSKIDTSKLP